MAIVLGLVVPRLFITNYGSDINGLIGTITQIYTYMALLEAGIGQAARNALFKPFQEKDQDEINNVTSIATNYYRKFTLIYAGCVIVISFILPIVLKTNVDRITIFWVSFLEGLSGVVSFYYIETYTIILAVDGKSYINNGILLATKIIGYIIKIIMAVFGLNIILLQFAYFVVNIFKVIVYKAYIKKKYFWLNPNKKNISKNLKDRNSYVITEIASTIFNSTDMIVLSVFISTQIASVYSIYNMIYTNIHLLLNSVYFSVVYVLGKLYHKNLQEYEKAHDAFEMGFLSTVTIFMSVTYVLIIPFVSLYTKGVNDVEYINKSLPILFCLVQILSWSRYVTGNLTGIAGYAKQTSYISIIEAVTNLTLSILLVNFLGIEGVLLATVIALPLKVIWCAFISDKKVMRRSCKKTLFILGTNYLLFASVVFVSRYFSLNIQNYMQFVIWGVVLTICISSLGIMLNIVFNHDSVIFVWKHLIRRLNK